MTKLVEAPSPKFAAYLAGTEESNLPESVICPAVPVNVTISPEIDVVGPVGTLAPEPVKALPVPENTPPEEDVTNPAVDIPESVMPETVIEGLPVKPPEVPDVFNARVLLKVGVPVKDIFPLKVGAPVNVPLNAAPFIVVADKAFIVIEGEPVSPAAVPVVL